ncbi:MAG: penicillin-binding protein 2 [Candidatus Desulfofervidaceae bacterium]|nr:penicillin-binding protein 2 [Candidatus Desulfofervidaceae bacterium]
MPLNQELILESWKRHLKLLRFIIVIAFLIIVFRLLLLQLINGKKYAYLAENNHIEVESITPPRGIIYDRNGVTLATNQPCFCLLLYPQKLPRHQPKVLKQYAKFLAPILKKTPEEVEGLLKDSLKYPLRPIYLKKKLSWTEVTAIETRSYFYSALRITVTPLRFYPLHSLGAHLLGYVGLITAEQLKENVFPGAEPTDFVGQIGIEKAWQRELAGYKGKRYLEVDALGRVLRVIKEIPPVPGNNIYLSIDIHLQKFAERLLRHKKGAIVALNPHNGEVLALVSSPNFDPNLFVQGLDPKTWQKLVKNPYHPLENRVTAGLYPPGSIFKVVTALAGLQTKVITPRDLIYCNGTFPLGNHIFRCWKKGGHGWVDIKKALIQSCDVFFYQLGIDLGIEKIASYASQCGFGHPTGIGIKEADGLIPTPDWKWQTRRKRWHKGDTVNVAIGQGAVLVTPLQIAQFFVALANGGNIYRPQVVLKITSPTGKVIREIKPTLKAKLPISKRNLKIINQALAGVMNNPLGTGYKARSDHILIAGKTGTAQVISLPKKKSNKVSPFYQDHAWFAGFAPVKNPQIVVVVLIEHGGHGGATAAPLARDLIEAYLDGQK